MFMDACFILRSQLVTCMPCLLLLASEGGGGVSNLPKRASNKQFERASVANSCDVVRSLYLRAMEVVEPPSKTRPRFQYTLLEEYPLPLPAADEDDPLDVLRTRVFRWAEDRGRKLGDFRSPQWTSRGYVLVGKCVKHTDCHAGKGRHFKFRGGQAENLRTYILSVWTSGTCSGEDRVLRPTVACGTGPTHQDREDVLHIADQLLARNVPCTPTNVSGQLKRLIEPKHIAAILRQRRRQFGRNASQWAASIPEFEAWAVASSNDYEADLRVARYEIRPEVRWVLLLRPFWEKLQELLPEPLLDVAIWLDLVGFAFWVWFIGFGCQSSSRLGLPQPTQLIGSRGWPTQSSWCQ